MDVFKGFQAPDSVSIELETLTPLYTGGVGQRGEQLHPSGLLGGLRRFSCLLAVALGDKDFEQRVWGTAADAKEERHAKGVALQVDSGGLGMVKLPGRVLNKTIGGYQHRGWFFNRAQGGTLVLRLTRRGISDEDWQLMLLALRIQLRWATLGAQDQFGLGVVRAKELPRASALDAGETANPLGLPGLHRAFFARLEFAADAPEGWETRLEQGLRWRIHLRGALRRKEKPKPGETELRHYVFGELNRTGSAVNISALYPLGSGRCAIRVWGVLPHTDPARFEHRRAEVMGVLKKALETGPDQAAERLIWEDGAVQGRDLAAWINRLAGVNTQ